MRTAAAYIRVSTTDQIEYSPESQLRLIKEYAEKNDIILIEEYIFRDEGISGRSVEKRPSFQKMIVSAKQKKFDVILIYSTSRFARNHEQSIIYRSMLEKECGIKVISITQPNIDKKTDMLTTAIYSIMDEWYSLDLSENVKRGMTEKAMQGGHQAQAPFGYERKYKGETMVIKEDEAEIVKYIFEQFLKNKSKWAIARDLKRWEIKSKKGADISTRSIYYILRNPVYKGYSRWTPNGHIYWNFKNKDSIIVKGEHEAILDEKVFDDVQKKLDEQEEITKKNSRPNETMKHWLSGLIKCSECGQSLNYNGATAKKKASFRCGGYNKGTCNRMNFITMSEAEKNVTEYLRKISEDINILYRIEINKRENNTEETNFLKKEIEKNAKKLERAKQGFLDGLFTIEEFKKIKESCEREINNIKLEMEKYERSEIDYLPFHKNIDNIFGILTSDNFDKNEKQIAIRSIVEKIVFDSKSREFRIYFYR